MRSSHRSYWVAGALALGSIPVVRSLQRSLWVAGALAVASIPAHANYRSKAIEQMDFIQRSFYDSKETIYRGKIPVDPKGLPFDVSWGNGVQLTALTGGARYEPDRYKSTLLAFSGGLRRYWDDQVPIPGFDAYFASPTDNDKYYDDNEWFVLGLLDAYNVTKDARYLRWARQTQNFALSGWDDKLGGGIYWQQNKLESKNTCSNGPAAVSALALYNVEHKPEDLDWAKRIYAWTKGHLQDTDGLYLDNIAIADGKITKWKFTYNSALMMRAADGLWRATKDPVYKADAIRIADASLKEFADPATGAFKDSARFDHLLSEALLQEYETTRDLRYLNAVRRDADFAYRNVRDAKQGGYYSDWKIKNRAPDERKELIENAAVARLFWLLTPYPDVEELQAKGDDAFKRGDAIGAARFFRDALASTSGTPATAPATATTPAA